MRASKDAYFWAGELGRFGAREELERHLLDRLIGQLVARGEIVRVRRGQFRLPETAAGHYLGLEGLANTGHRYLSHRSAMAAHGHGPPLPHAEIFVTTDEYRRSQNLTQEIAVRLLQRGARFRGPSVAMHVPGIGPFPVATPETTLVDALIEPRLCGGLLEVCSFIARRRGTWDAGALVKRARTTRMAAVCQRVGFLLELAKDPTAPHLEALLPSVGASAQWLDPTAPLLGATDERWRIRVNVPSEHLRSALGATPA